MTRAGVVCREAATVLPGRSNAANLEELRDRLTAGLALGLLIASGFLLWLTLLLWTVFPTGFPLLQFLLLSGLLGVSAYAWRQGASRPRLTRHLLVWAPSALLVAAMAIFPDPWLPFLGLVTGIAGAVLVPGSGPLAAGAVALTAIALCHSGLRDYPVLAVLPALVFGTVVTWLVARAFYTALLWAWSTQQRADELLKLARDRQYSLSRALKSLDNANTVLVNTQRDLVIARQRAEEARLVKEQFAANVSHELRTPLSLILGFSEVMCLSSEVYGPFDWPPALRQDVYQIYRNSRHLLGMIDDVLDLSRVETTGFTLNRERVSLEPLVRETVEIVGYLFRDRPVSLHTDVALNLPDLEVDGTRIRQVLLNLLNNAARFTEEGEVRVVARLEGQDVVVSVQDTGPGIPANKLSHVFDEFYQVDGSLARQHGGVGLGLAISKHFVEAHGGRIWVDSTEDVGSAFSFALPVPETGTPFLRPRTLRPLELPPDERLQPVLLVDSDAYLTGLVSRYVGRHEVVQIKNLRGLARAVRLHRPWAIVHNVKPGEHSPIDGADAGSAPIIELSLPSTACLKNDLAVVGYLNKPITRERLLREIKRVGNVRDVLVVDDERAFCQLVERILASDATPYRIQHAYGGKKGLQAVRRHHPDVVLLDLMMPDMDGFGVLQAMRRDPALADVPVILLTVTSYLEDQLARPGGQLVVRRPEGIRPADTLRCLAALLPVLEPDYIEPDALQRPPHSAVRRSRRP